MTLTIKTQQNTYTLDGPHTHVGTLSDQSGVYAITTFTNGFHKIIDVGESETVKKRVSTHDRSDSWKKHMADTLYVSVIYCNERDRMLFESDILDTHNPPCGDR